MKNKILTILLCIFTVLLTVTVSIALPIVIRPFYYMHIDTYNLTYETGKSKQQIIEAYDQVLDYLTLPNKEFSAGDFKFTESGKSHFADCKTLFTLNFSVLLVSLAGILVLNILKRKKLIKFCNLFRFNVTFTCGAVTLLLFLLIGGLASMDFDKAFVVFHNIFFYGKDNWIFDSRYDQIISALPQEFFLNCALLIISSIVIISLILIIFALIQRKKVK